MNDVEPRDLQTGIRFALMIKVFEMELVLVSLDFIDIWKDTFLESSLFNGTT